MLRPELSPDDEVDISRLSIRFSYENPLLDGIVLGATCLCCDDMYLRDDIDKAYVRERALSDMLDKLSDSLHEQKTKVLRPGVRIGTHVTCEHCVHCVQLEGRPNWMSCRRGHFGPTVICDSSLSFFCADGEPKEEQDAGDKM